MVIICEESLVYESTKNGEGGELWNKDKKRKRERKKEQQRTRDMGSLPRRRETYAGTELPLRSCQRTFRYENKTNKSRASDIRVMGNEMGCRCDDLFLASVPVPAAASVVCCEYITCARSARVCTSERRERARNARASDAYMRHVGLRP